MAAPASRPQRGGTHQVVSWVITRLGHRIVGQRAGLVFVERVHEVRQQLASLTIAGRERRITERFHPCVHHLVVILEHLTPRARNDHGKDRSHAQPQFTAELRNRANKLRSSRPR